MMYPVLCIPESLGVHVAKNHLELGQCVASLFWKQNVYKGMVVVDSSGNRYEVSKATVYKPISRFMQRIARFLDLQICLRIELEDRGVAPLPEVVSAVLASINEDPEMCEELTGKSVEWWQTVMGNSANSKEVILALDHPEKNEDRIIFPRLKPK